MQKLLTTHPHKEIVKINLIAFILNCTIMKKKYAKLKSIENIYVHWINNSNELQFI